MILFLYLPPSRWEISWIDTSSEQHQQTAKQSTTAASGGVEVAAGDNIAARNAVGEEDEGSGLKSTNSSPNLDLNPALAGNGRNFFRLFHLSLRCLCTYSDLFTLMRNRA